MKKSRYDVLVASITTVARKVFMAVPAQERWQLKTINAELIRTGVNLGVRAVEGCLESLIDVGLVREAPGGYYMRITPKEVESTVVDVGEQETVTVTPVVVPEPEPAPAQDEVYEQEPAQEPVDEPFKLVPMERVPQRDGEYENYLSVRYERAIKALTVLAEHADPELGLALLEVVEDMENLHERVLDYRHDLDCPPQQRLELNPGWFHHVVNDQDYFTKSAEPPSIDEIAARREADQAMKAAWQEIHKVHPFLIQQKQEEAEWIDGLFRKFEPDGIQRPYYDSLLDSLKDRIPDLNTDTSEEHLEEVREKLRGDCDLPIRGVSQSHEYRSWTNLLAQTQFPVEPDWKSFRAFLADVGFKPHLNARFVRLDKELGWVRGNTEWRLEGRALEGLQRRPRNWPFNQGRVSLAKSLDRTSREAVKMLLSK